MSSLDQIPTDIIVHIFASLHSFTDISNLSKTCKRFYNITRSNSNAILCNIAKNVFLPEAHHLLETYRSVTYAQKQRLMHTLNKTEQKFQLGRTALGEAIDKRKGWISGLEMKALKADAKVVDAIVEEVVKAARRVVKLEISEAREWGRPEPNVPKEMDENVKREVKRAVYNLAILSCHFNLATVKGHPDPAQVTKQVVNGLLEKGGDGLLWQYDYSYAASLSVRGLFGVIALGRYLWGNKWPVLEMTVGPNSADANPLAEGLSDFNEASLKRFAFVNFLDSSKIGAEGPDEPILKCFDSCWCDAFWNQVKWVKACRGLEDLRTINGLGFNDRYNSLVFEKKEQKILTGDGGSRMKEMLTVKENGWLVENTDKIGDVSLGTYFSRENWFADSLKFDAAYDAFVENYVMQTMGQWPDVSKEAFIEQLEF